MYKNSSRTVYIVFMIVVFGKGSNWKKSNKLTLKNRTSYFYNDKTDLKNFEPNLLKIDTKS